jgi:hypothetical protein
MNRPALVLVGTAAEFTQAAQTKLSVPVWGMSALM